MQKAKTKHEKTNDALKALEYFGGFEIAQMCGAMIEAYHKNMLLLIVGFVATSAFLCAYRIENKILGNAIFCHQSSEYAHKKMLSYIGVKPILDIRMRLGEGTGCAVAYSLIQSAVNFMNEMASFNSAGISNKSNEYE